MCGCEPVGQLTGSSGNFDGKQHRNVETQGILMPLRKQNDLDLALSRCQEA